MAKTFYSHGKLLLTGEYLVLDGARALAVPTKKGQSLKVEPSGEKGIFWESLDINGNPWFSAILSFEEIDAWDFSENPSDARQRLLQILASAKALNPEFLNTPEGIKITTKLDFPQDWGLGSSSTLIYNIATWANADPYELLQKTFGGSGYDIACAKNDSAILYQLINGKPKVTPVNFNPPFAENLFFVHLNKKQNSREAIRHYRQQPKSKVKDLGEKISEISGEILKTDHLQEFKTLIDEHEEILSEILNLSTIKSRLFPDFHGSVKSLGGWGGDFILVTGDAETMSYFRDKGFGTVISFKGMVL